MGFSYPKDQQGGESNALKNGLSIAEKIWASVGKMVSRLRKMQQVAFLSLSHGERKVSGKPTSNE